MAFHLKSFHYLKLLCLSAGLIATLGCSKDSSDRSSDDSEDSSSRKIEYNLACLQNEREACYNAEFAHRGLEPRPASEVDALSLEAYGESESALRQCQEQFRCP